MPHSVEKVAGLIKIRPLFLCTLILLILPAAKPIRFVNYGEVLIDWDPRRFPELVERVQTVLDSLDLSYANYDTVDARFGNYEGTIESDSGTLSAGLLKPDGVDHVGQPPILYTMRDLLKINLVSLANNHSFDAREEGVLQTIEEINKTGMTWAGIGRNTDEVKAAGILTLNDGTRIGMIAGTMISNSRDDYRAYPTANDPGIWLMNPERYGYDTGDEFGESAMLEVISEVAPTVDFMAVYNHNHWDNYGDDDGIIDDSDSNRDDYRLQNFARQVIDAGADIFMIDGPHQPICFDIYNDRPIMYSNGNFFYNTRQEMDGYPDRSWWNMVTDILYDEANNTRAIKVYPIETNEVGLFGDYSNEHDEDAINDKQLYLHYATRGNPQIATGSVADEIFEHVNNLCEGNGFDLLERDGDVAYWPGKSAFETASGGVVGTLKPGSFRVPVLIKALSLPGGKRKLVIEFQEARNLSLDIYNVAGKKVWTYISSEKLQKQNVKLPASLVNGLYVARVNSEGKHQSTRFMLTD